MRVAIVTPQFGNSSSEDQLIVRRVAGALSVEHSVTVLHPHLGDGPSGPVGSLNVIPFREEGSRTRYAALGEASFGGRSCSGYCTCYSQHAKELGRSLPRFVQEELARASGGNSPDLFSHLREVKYDLVVFAGYSFASTRFGLDYVPASTKVILLPLAREEPLFWMPTYDSVFSRPDRILVTTRTEELLVLGRIGDSQRERVFDIRFVLNVNRLAFDTSPAGRRRKSFVVAGGESLDRSQIDWLKAAAALTFAKMNMELVVLEPKGRASNGREWFEREVLVSRSDLWRWMTRALAFIDPRPKRILGREVLEAYLLGTPVLVSRDGGANLEHADEGNGGLWFSGFNELEAGLNLLADDDLRGTLGQQGREYALREYGDSAKFIQRVNEAVLDKET